MSIFLIRLEFSKQLMCTVLIDVKVLTEFYQHLLTSFITQTKVYEELHELAKLIKDHGLIGFVHLLLFFIDIGLG